MKPASLLLPFFLAGLLSAGEFSPRQVVPPFDPIKNPPIAPATESSRWVHAKELVLGVRIGDESRAYPINQLTNPTREIINDNLGDRSIAATW